MAITTNLKVQSVIHSFIYPNVCTFFCPFRFRFFCETLLAAAVAVATNMQ